MRIFESLDEIPKPLAHPVMAIGFFDGVHCGHRRILEQVINRARGQSGTSVLLTFHPHPQKVISPADAPPLLQTAGQKEEILAQLGVDILIKLPFTRRFSLLSPREFAHDVLYRQGIREIHVGANFRFGHRRSGDFPALKDFGREFGFEVFDTEVVTFRGARVSSTRIRQFLLKGNVSLARRLLLRPYSINGTVVRGSGRGVDLGFPTANLNVENELVPAPGVYVTRALVNGQRSSGATNIGYRPTLQEVAPFRPVVETYLLNFKGDIYGRSMQLDFLFRLRCERKFEGVDALKAQIERDVCRCRCYMRRAGPFLPGKSSGAANRT